MDRWQGKWALVTGASAGIGWALAQELAANGAHLVVTARRRERLEQLAQEIRDLNRASVEIVTADLTQPSAPEEIFRFTEQKGLVIDLLVNNAGFGAYGEFHRIDLARQLAMVQVNIATVIHLTHLYLPQMIARRRGDVLIVASTAAFQAVPYVTTYAATKAFDLLFAEGLAEEMRRYGVRVCALCPGSTSTEFEQVAGEPDRSFRHAESARKVAQVGLRALDRGKSYVISGARNYWSAHLQRLVTRGMVTRIAAGMFRPKES